MTAGLYEQLKDDLGYLQLERAAETFARLAETAQRQDWTHIQFLAELIGDQAAATRNRRMTARLRYARFPFRRTIDEFDFDFQPSIDRKLIQDLATLRFVEQGRPILLLGQPGCGKTHLAVALAIRVVEAGWRGYFTTADDMTRTLVRAQVEGNWVSKLKTLHRADRARHRRRWPAPDPRPRRRGAIFHVVNTRYERKHPTIVKTNRGLPDWARSSATPVVAAAILDRLMHNAVVFNIKGPSWRLREHHALAAASTTEPNPT